VRRYGVAALIANSLVRGDTYELVAKLDKAPNIDELRLPFYTEISPGLYSAYGETES
jgi:hypothetical protein